MIGSSPTGRGWDRQLGDRCMVGESEAERWWPRLGPLYQAVGQDNANGYLRL